MGRYDLPAVEIRQSLANARGKIGRLVRRPCVFGDVALCSKNCERQIHADLAPFVKELIDMAIGEQPPVQASLSTRCQRMLANGSCTVLGQGVVPSGMIREAINLS